MARQTDRLVDLETFCAVIDAGSFVGAAEVRGLPRIAAPIRRSPCSPAFWSPMARP